MTAERRIAVVTGSRAEYGLLYRLIGLLHRDEGAELQLIVTGAHLSPAHGLTVSEIERDGFPIAAKVDMELGADDAAGLAAAMGRGLAGFGAAFAQLKPDFAVVLGDRYEILSAASAAMLARVPIAHLHGGEATFGLIDEAVRHAVTKMAHLHFVSADPYARRVIQMGEAPERVFNVGALALDTIAHSALPGAGAVLEEIGLAGGGPLLMLTYHPVTLTEDTGLSGVRALLAALEKLPETHRILVTGTNADTAGRGVAGLIEDFAKRQRSRVRFVNSLGHLRYLSVLEAAHAAVGNSSSGIIEAPALGTPTVNIGPRQDGRLRAPSVIDCGEEEGEISAAIERALSEDMQKLAARRATPYGTGQAAEKIMDVLMSTDPSSLIIKTFHDLDISAMPGGETRKCV